MTILPAGSFSTSDFRKPIPWRVKQFVLLRDCERAQLTIAEAAKGEIEYDHRPPLVTRDYDTDADDFIPPQHDPAHIFACRKAKHDERTFGRKDGAAKTVTTRGSDIGEAARTRRLRNSQILHNYKMAAKLHGEAEASKQYPQVARLIVQRLRKRKINGRNDLGRR